MTRRLFAVATCTGLLSGTGCCLDLLKAHLPDAGSFTLPDSGVSLGDGGIWELLYEQSMPDPTPGFDGGTVTYPGGLSLTTTFDGGARILTVSSGGGVLKTYVDWNGDGTDVTGTGDTNQDGVVDYQYSSQYDGISTYTTTILTDENFDGVFDKQDVWSVDISQGTPYQKTETVTLFVGPDGGFADSADGGSWVQDWTYSGPAVTDRALPGTDLRHQPRCNGYDGFPDTSDYTGKYRTVPKTNIRVVDDNSYPGACNDNATDLIVIAIEDALEDIPLCYQAARPASAADLWAIQTTPLVIGCGNTCDGFAASTELPQAPDTHLAQYGYLAMNINEGPFFDGPSPQWKEEIILHELLHFAGHDHSPPPAGNPEGHDMVYGCGRYCTQGGFQAATEGLVGGCRTCNGAATIGWGNGTPTAQQFAFDCADCSDDANRKSCGFMANVTDCSHGDCRGGNAGCPAGTFCCNWYALSCWGDQAADPGDRATALIPYSQSNCNQNQCADEDPAPNCTVGNPEDLGAPPAGNCQTFPFGWCQAGGC